MSSTFLNDENKGDIVIYQSESGETKIDVRFQDETVWLTQTQLCELYQSSKANVSEHIKNIFEEGELEQSAVVRKIRTTAADGKTYAVNHYNLDMIISLGYRIKSSIATQFRRWATERLKEYMIKGFTMDDERLKNLGGGSYWKEFLDRIRDIRSSEKVMYRQVLDLYATSVDYDPKSAESVAFFKMVQNKLHYAAHGHTAAEVIFERADAEKPFMGLTAFSGDFPTAKDITVAKKRGTAIRPTALAAQLIFDDNQDQIPDILAQLERDIDQRANTKKAEKVEVDVLSLRRRTEDTECYGGRKRGFLRFLPLFSAIKAPIRTTLRPK